MIFDVEQALQKIKNGTLLPANLANSANQREEQNPKKEELPPANLANLANPGGEQANISNISNISKAEEPNLKNREGVPEPCLDCSRQETIEGIGSGCVRELPDSSSWREEWQRIPAELTHCPRKEVVDDENPTLARGFGCGRCGENKYIKTGTGWQCLGCGLDFITIGGSRGPQIIKRR